MTERVKMKPVRVAIKRTEETVLNKFDLEIELSSFTIQNSNDYY
jgi:hypothetical protein